MQQERFVNQVVHYTDIFFVLNTAVNTCFKL